MPDSREAAAPFTFADPDGLELELESLTVMAAVAGPLSLTEMEMVFRNPRDRRTEGRFACVLPEGAAISRLAKEVDGRLMEGEVVERLRANQIYEAILNQLRDPALLEQDQGNRYAVRIFPIEPLGSARIVLSWSRLLREHDGVRTFTVPLRGLSRIGRFSFVGHFSSLPSESVTGPRPASDVDEPSVSTSHVVSFEKADWSPEQDLHFSWPAGRSSSLLRVENEWVAVLHPSVETKAPAVNDQPLVFLVDTSASSADGLLHRVHAMEALLASLDQRPVEIFAFDHQVAPLLSGRAREVSASIREALLKRGFLGATNLHAMLTWLTQMAGEDAGRTFVIVSDGAATIGPTSSGAIASAVAKLPSSTVVHALVLGARRHDEALRTITEGRGRIVSVPFTRELERHATEAGARLLLPLGETLTLRAENAEFIWPDRAEDFRAGDEIIVVGRMPRGAQPSLEIVDPSGRRTPVLHDVEALPDRFQPLLEREVARGYLELLARRERDETVPAIREALISEQVRVSIASRVVIPRTTLLVLESESDFARFGVDRRALGRILTIRAQGIDYLDRSRPALSSAQPIVRVGTVRGRVVHEGAPLPGVAVTVRSPAIQGARTTVTDVQGIYSFPALPAGKYDVTMELEGLETRRTVLTVPPGSSTMFEDTALSLSAVSEAITVTALAPAVLETTAVSSNFSGEVIEQLPVGNGIAGPTVPTESMELSSTTEPITVTASAPIEVETTEILTTITNDGTIRPLPGGASTPGRASTYRPSERTIDRWLEPRKASLDTLEQAVKDDPLDRAAWSALAEQLALRTNWARLAEVTREWQLRDPMNPQVYELIGELALATADRGTAERAFGSLVETSASNPELVQRAGMLLFRTGNLELAESALRQAHESRPDRVNGWRHLALVIWQSGRHEDAVTILEAALATPFNERQRDVHRVIREELGYVLRDWIRVAPERRAELESRAATAGVDLRRRDALRITLAWDTDANDVDLHVIDPSGEEVYYEHLSASSGLELYEDVTQGFGPEVVRTGSLDRGTYQVGVNYYAVGPMGVSRGIVVIIRDEDTGGGADVQVLPFRLRPERGSVMKVADLRM